MRRHVLSGHQFCCPRPGNLVGLALGESHFLEASSRSDKGSRLTVPPEARVCRAFLKRDDNSRVDVTCLFSFSSLSATNRSPVRCPVSCKSDVSPAGLPHGSWREVRAQASTVLVLLPVGLPPKRTSPQPEGRSSFQLAKLFFHQVFHDPHTQCTNAT